MPLEVFYFSPSAEFDVDPVYLTQPGRFPKWTEVAMDVKCCRRWSRRRNREVTQRTKLVFTVICRSFLYSEIIVKADFVKKLPGNRRSLILDSCSAAGRGHLRSSSTSGNTIPWATRSPPWRGGHLYSSSPEACTLHRSRCFRKSPPRSAALSSVGFPPEPLANVLRHFREFTVVVVASNAVLRPCN